MAAFVGAAEREPDLAQLRAGLTLRRRAPFVDVLGRAHARGEIAADADLDTAIDMLVDQASTVAISPINTQPG